MQTVRGGPLAGLIGAVVLLIGLAMTPGLDAAGWCAGLGCAVGTAVLLHRAMAGHGTSTLGPADRVTLTRASLVAGVTALIATSLHAAGPTRSLVALSALALVLDAVDGRVARRTGTASALGARFDMEVDAFLILVLSGYVARTAGLWVLAIGLARYGLVLAGWGLPWLRATVPPRHWCKVVAAVQGIALTLSAARVLPAPGVRVLLVSALVLLVESFARQVWWLWRLRPARAAARPGSPAPVAAGSRT